MTAGGDSAKMAKGFKALGLVDELVETVAALGYEEPTPIQREVIPLFLKEADILAQAATGTGKTAAFALPMLQRIAGDGAARGSPRGLVLVPTRELAMQVSEAFHKYGRRVGVTVVPVYGGAPIDQQVRALKRGVEVVIATPGRAMDHIRRGTLVLDRVKIVVLDEADEMLDLGFAEDLDAILAATPGDRQTALFSATMPSRIAAIASRHLKTPKRVTIAREVAKGEIPKVRQMAYIVPRGQKPAALSRVLELEAPTSVIVFCRTRFEVDDLSGTLLRTATARNRFTAASAAPERPRDEGLSRGTGRRARRHRRRRARTRHRAPLARRELRRPIRAGVVPPPRRVGRDADPRAAPRSRWPNPGSIASFGRSKRS